MNAETENIFEHRPTVDIYTKKIENWAFRDVAISCYYILNFIDFVST